MINMIFSIVKYLHRSLHVKQWWLVLPNQLGILSSKEKLRKINLSGGLEFWVRPNTRDINEVLAVGLGHEYPQAAFCKLNKISNLVMFDCGAHIGSFAAYASKLLPEANIISLEPETNNFKMLKENIKLNNLQSKVVAVQAAIVPVDDYVNLCININNNGHSVKSTGAEHGQNQKVEGLSFNTLIKLSLIHI